MAADSETEAKKSSSVLPSSSPPSSFLSSSAIVSSLLFTFLLGSIWRKQTSHLVKLVKVRVLFATTIITDHRQLPLRLRTTLGSRGARRA